MGPRSKKRTARNGQKKQGKTLWVVEERIFNKKTEGIVGLLEKVVRNLGLSDWWEVGGLLTFSSRGAGKREGLRWKNEWAETFVKKKEGIRQVGARCRVFPLRGLSSLGDY